MKATLNTARQVFEEQIAAFAQRLNLVGTQRYDDLRAQEHYRAFAVAGAMKADLLSDLHEAVRKSVVDGATIQDFRKDFRTIVERHGWHGWTGEGTRLGEAWRTRVIYTTNTRKSYSAGRYAQLTDPAMTAVRPYWRWVHSGLAKDPRPEHLAWHGMTLRHDDPFWQTHFPPRIPPDYGCGCRVVAVREPAAGAQTVAPAGWERNADPGAGAPPQDVVADIRSFVEEKRRKLPPELARAFGEEVAHREVDLRHILGPHGTEQPAGTALATLSAAHVVSRLNSTDFADFYEARPGTPERFPVAVLTPADQPLLGASTSTVWLSRTSLDEHRRKHPEITLDDYRQIPTIIREGQVWGGHSDRRYVLLWVGGRAYRAAIKIDRNGREVWFLSLVVSPKQKPPKGAVQIR